MRWSEIEPALTDSLSQLLSWVKTESHPSEKEVGLAFADDGIVATIVDRFDSLIGLWVDGPDDG
jgi:hypothetical protein